MLAKGLLPWLSEIWPCKIEIHWLELSFFIVFRTLNPIHFFSKKETQKQVKIISINNPLVFLNAKKFHADLMNIIQKEQASNQPFDDTSKVGSTGFTMIMS